MDPFLYALAAVAVLAMWRQHARRAREPLLLTTRLGEDAEIALHVADHEAGQRGRALTAMCVLYGLLQDEAITAAIQRTGGDPEAIEDRVLAALDAGDEDVYAEPIVAWVLATAGHRGRRVTCVDLWAALAQAVPAVVDLIGHGGVRAADVLFTLVHGVPEKDVPWPDGDPVSVVLVNDDHTTQAVVVEILCDVFDLGDEVAHDLMLRVHHGGRGVVGQYPAREARSRIEAARQRARSKGSPLWFEPE